MKECIHLRPVSPENANNEWCVYLEINIDPKRAVCDMCRSDIEFRGKLRRRVVKKENPKQLQEPKKLYPCKHGEVTDKRVPNRPCFGCVVICHHPEYDGIMSSQRGCRPTKCKFYEAKEDDK